MHKQIQNKLVFKKLIGFMFLHVETKKNIKQILTSSRKTYNGQFKHFSFLNQRSIFGIVQQV